MKVPQHTITNSTLTTIASEELQKEIESELEKAKANDEPTPDMDEILATLSVEEDCGECDDEDEVDEYED